MYCHMLYCDVKVLQYGVKFIRCCVTVLKCGVTFSTVVS